MAANSRGVVCMCGVCDVCAWCDVGQATSEQSKFYMTCTIFSKIN